MTPALLLALQVLTCGDSLTAAGGWQSQLSPDLQTVNCAAYGAASWHGAHDLPNVQSLGSVRDALAANPEADAIVLFYGTNDVRWAEWAGNGFQDDGRYTDETTHQAFEQMVAESRAAGLAVVLVVPPPILAIEGTTTPENARLFNTNITELLRRHLREVAKGRAVIADLHAAFMARDAQGLMACLYTAPNDSTDGVHMGSFACPDGVYAAKLIAAQIERALRRALR